MKKKVVAKRKKTSVTIDELATMVAGGFSSLEERLTSRIDGLEERFDSRIDSLEERLDGRVNGVEAKLNSIHSEMLSLHFDQRKFKARLEGVEQKVFGSIQEA